MDLLFQKSCVIPANAGIHGLSYKSEQQAIARPIGPAMDSRVRGNDKILFLIFFAFLIAIASPVLAQGVGRIPEMANQQLPDPKQEADATRLMHGLRCIQCQGQSIADSDAPMAATMRAEVRQQIAAGQKPEAIREWMIGRYGEWVSFEPDMKGAGLLLWIAPLLLLLVAVWLARGLFQRRT